MSIKINHAKTITAPDAPGDAAAGKGLAADWNADLVVHASSFATDGEMIAGTLTTAKITTPAQIKLAVETHGGVDGLSAYQIAVNNGFVGTEAAWLASLQGAPGAPGLIGKHVIGYWPAAAIKPSITEPCAALAWGETTTNKINYGYLAFDAGANEYAHFSFRAPKSLDETVGFTAVLTVAEESGATTHNSAWTIQALALSTTDVLDAALSTAVQVNITTASGQVTLSAESAAITPAGVWSEGDMIYVQIGRYATDATNDTLNADAHLIGVTLYATYDAAVEP